MTSAEAEDAWRRACWRYLDALFASRDGQRIRDLGFQVVAWRVDMDRIMAAEAARHEQDAAS